MFGRTEGNHKKNKKSDMIVECSARDSKWRPSKCKWKFDVHMSVHHHTIQTIQPTRCNSFTSLLLDVYVWLNMFRASPRPSSGAYDCTRSLRFNRWREAAGALLVVVCQVIPKQRFSRFSPTVKPEASSAVVSSWWWAGRRPKHVEPHINVK